VQKPVCRTTSWSLDAKAFIATLIVWAKTNYGANYLIFI
jgi:hypothetical protein